MKFKKYLNEKTFNIGKDVDFLYKKYFKKHIKLFQSGKIEAFKDDLNKTNGVYGVISSSLLPSKKAQKASELNPVNIEMGVFNTSSYYQPFDKEIRLTLNKPALDLLFRYKTVDDIRKALGDKTYERWSSEINEPSIKGTIYHELSHWMDDTFHNKHITKKLIKVKEVGSRDVLAKGFGNVNLGTFELDAQVHAIKQLKRNFRKTWDDVTWDFIVQHKSSFDVVFKIVKHASKKDRNSYMKRLYKRLNREKLLGKSLINGFNDFIRQM